ncbi:MAG TPA: TonB-dependent receptor [Sphingomonas sp.]|uniref:TonB-dependent receptor domain-containing protein n=1 Tax=Sphingomonas sp. TaxID=28214 RepID=UPI002B95B397|nr:TonB-dependent receptor [Sphingomonas sp.]HMI20676.1 TonB-dependent receptor [Sphingomonas sp.]
MTTFTGRLFAGSALSAMLVALASPAAAQTALPAAAPIQTADATPSSEDIVVTGTIFRRTNTETPSPVTVLTSDSLVKAGIVTATDAIRSVSADSAGSIGIGFQSGFSAGGSAVSLRGLGVSSTLVLVDGLRSTNFPINDDGHNAYVDLQSIPFSLIDRIEVLKDGASSTYGADAIGGVVNLILKKHFTGVDGNLEGGIAQEGDAGHQRAHLTLGYGDYDADGWNVYINGEYEHDGRVSNHSRGFPYNTQDLSSIGGLDQNTADSSLTTATPNAVVTRVHQNDLNNPLSGAPGTPLTSTYTSLNLNCAGGTYTVTTGGAQGTGCKYDLVDKYNQISPLQRRYSANGRLSIRFNDHIEGYVTGSYSNSYVSILNQPRAIRATQPFGGSPTLSASNPGIVLPVYICSSGTNCATAADRHLNPNNPYAAAFANDPANGAARVYYLFGDVTAGSDRTNEVIRGSAGLNGDFEGFDWKVEAVGAKDNLKIVQHGYANIAGLLKAINTGSYNFVNPAANSEAVRQAVLPDVTTPSYSSLVSLDGSVTHALATLPGGDLMLGVGGQVRKEKLVNRNQNAKLDTYTLTTSSAFGQHTVSAGYFELNAPILKQLEVDASGRYDHYSEGFSHFSPKVGFKFTPIKQLALRGTYSKGFRAPTFAESGPLSQFAGFSTYSTPASFAAAHGGTANPYSQSYSLGSGIAGNPNLKPELSRSFTGGFIAQPVRWLSFTVDYYNVKKSRLIIAGPLTGDARTAYYSKTNVTDACAAVAAVGPGYSCNLIDAVDPLFPNALPRVLIINAPFVNANYALTSGLDFSATATIPLGDGIRLTSKAEATVIIKYDVHTSGGVQKYAGTLGPYELSSGNGTTKWRGNWQNTLEVGKFNATATAYYVGHIKSVAADERASTDCVTGNQYATGNTTIGKEFCYIKSFINVDANLDYAVNDKFDFYVNVGNVFNARAPIAPGAYASAPNYLTSWHYAGLIGRTFRAGANFKF